MSAPVIARGDAVKIARQLGKAGRPLPPEMADDDEYAAAHAEGSGQPMPTKPTPAPASRPARKTAPARKASPKKPANTRPANRRPSTGNGSRPGYFARAFAPSAAAGRVADATGMRAVARGGDAGGLLLMIVIYPIGLAVAKYGAAGPGMWFRAKWLNEATDPASLKPTNPTTPSGRPLPKRNPLGGGIVINGGK